MQQCSLKGRQRLINRGVKITTINCLIEYFIKAAIISDIKILKLLKIEDSRYSIMMLYFIMRILIVNNDKCNILCGYVNTDLILIYPLDYFHFVQKHFHLLKIMVFSGYKINHAFV